MSTTSGPREVRAPRGTEPDLQGLAAGSRPADADEQPRSRGRRAPRGPGRLRRHRSGGALVGGVRRDRPRAARARGRRDAPRPVGQAGRRRADPRVGAARADREQQPRSRVGDLGGVPPARGARPDDVRPDDGGLVDLHRHAGHPAGHVRDVLGDRGEAIRRHARGHDLAHRGARRDGRRAAARGHDERRRRALRRGRPDPDRAPDQAPLPRRGGRGRRRGAAAGDRRPRSPRGPVDRHPRQRGRRRAAARRDGRADRHRHRPDERARSARLHPAGHDARGGRRPARRRRRRVHAARATPRWRRTAPGWWRSSTRAPRSSTTGTTCAPRPSSGGFDRAFAYPGFIPAYIRPLFCEGKGPFRWAALSGDPADIAATDRAVLEEFPDNEPLARWIRMAGERVAFQGLPARICWLGLRRAAPARGAVQRAWSRAARCRRRS